MTNQNFFPHNMATLGHFFFQKKAFVFVAAFPLSQGCGNLPKTK
jgi:hypothetical protein